MTTAWIAISILLGLGILALIIGGKFRDVLEVLVDVLLIFTIFDC